MFLKTIANQDKLFHKAIPAVPMGKYVHFVVLRETNSFSLFQTDQQLNFARVTAGRDDTGPTTPISRIVMFKRKQTTPERLKGRELLRERGLLSADLKADNYCEYNSERFCKVCPDCIFYGFAIGNEGSERSKVLVDSAFSLSDYDESHQAMTFNAPHEHGTMSQYGVPKKSGFGEPQDHVLPQVFFPTIVTLRDATEAGFIYVLNNIMQTRRYGAQTTRTGTMENHLVAIIFANGEVFSNLKLTQTLYDNLKKGDDGKAIKGPYRATELVGKIEEALPTLLKDDKVIYEALMAEALAKTVEEVGAIVSNEATLTEILQQAYKESKAYAFEFGAKAPKGKGNDKGKGKTMAEKGE